MSELNILQNYSSKLYNSYPFPFFEIENALPEDIYNQLKKDYQIFESYLENETNSKKNNTRLQVSTETFLSKKNVFKSSIWHDFISYHTSQDFFNNLMEIFGKDIEKIYPKTKLLIEERKNNKNFINHRSTSNNNEFEFVADCQPGINTPVQYLSSVRGPHVDNPVELLAGLFYLRDDSDQSTGGDLTIYETKNRIYFKNKAEVDNIKDLKLVKTIKYKKNQCVFFLNTINSVHAITPREKTSHKRYLTNIIFERYRDKNSFFKLNRKLNIFKKLKNLIKNN